jgi:hypothetical protein
MDTAVIYLNGAGYMKGDAATCEDSAYVIKKFSKGEISFRLLSAETQFTAVVFKEFINVGRPLMLSMKNHMWLVEGYNDTSHFMIHDPAVDNGPQAISFENIKKNLVQALVMEPALVKATSSSNFESKGSSGT